MESGCSHAAFIVTVQLGFLLLPLSMDGRQDRDS